MHWIVSHDAGGAEIISSWVKHHPENQYKFVISGPALTVFQKKLGSLDVIPFSQFKPSENDFVLTGMSWDTDVERDAIDHCLKHGIRVAHYLDHWENYTERFQRQLSTTATKPVFPNEVWAGDPFAFEIAKKTYAGIPNLEVKFVENCYFIDVAADVKKLSHLHSHANGLTILFLSEPFQELSTRKGIQNESDPFEYSVVSRIQAWLKEKHPSDSIGKFIFRLHPAEKPEKYARLLDSNFPYAYEISQGKNIADDLARSDWVIGIKSTALALAVICDKKVFSCIPGSTVSLTLPYPEITRI